MARKALIALGFAAVATSAAAEEVAPDPNHESKAWEIAYEMFGGVFTPEQEHEIVALAWHIAIGNLCDDLAVDQAKFAEAIGQFRHSDGADASDDEHAYFVNQVISNLSVAVGILLAENADDPAPSCEAAKEQIADPEFAHLFEVGD